MIGNALSKHFVFGCLSEENREKLTEQMKHYGIGPKEVVFQQGHPGSSFFIIAAGQVQVIINNQPVKQLVTSDSFGELALLHDAPRSATIQTTQKTALWGIDRNTFRAAVARMNREQYQDTKRFVESVGYFQDLDSR